MWTKENTINQTGKTVIVTGANTGIGFETALALYTTGAHVVLACRNENSAEEAITKIKKHEGKGTLEKAQLDLSSLDSVKQFALSFLQNHTKLDILINNAGIMIPPAATTAEGYELQFGVNFLGHFALTGYLYPLLKPTMGSRIVNLTSLAYTQGTINFENLRLQLPYNAMREYQQSKLANILFTLELQRRIKKAGDDILSLAAHPGVTKSELSRNMSDTDYNAAVETYGELMDTWQGALPSLYAATVKDVKGSDFYGPDKDGGLRGYPTLTDITPVGKDEATAKRLWDFAERVTGVTYPL